MEYKHLSLIQFGNDIFAPVSIKTAYIKQYLSLGISQINNIISIVYTFVYTNVYAFVNQFIKKEHQYISKIYKFIFGQDYTYNFIDNKIIILGFILCFGIYLYEKWNSNIIAMHIAIKQLQLENELLRTKIENQYNKNNIIASEIDTIHTEVVKCIKKIRKIENDVKNMDYY